MKGEINKFNAEKLARKSHLSSYKIYGSEYHRDDSAELLRNITGIGTSAKSDRVEKIKSISAMNLRKHIPQNIKKDIINRNISTVAKISDANSLAIIKNRQFLADLPPQALEHVKDRRPQMTHDFMLKTFSNHQKSKDKLNREPT